MHPKENIMKLVEMTGPALAALIVVACGANSKQASSPQLAAQQAEAEKRQSQDEARDAKEEAKKEQREAQQAARAERGAERNAQWATDRAALAESQATREAQTRPAPRVGATEPQADTAATVAGAKSTVHFAPNSAELSQDARAKLDELAGKLRGQTPSHNVMIEGYTDYAGSERTNTQLSDRRAREVADYLESKGVDRERIATKAHGKSPPAGKDTTDQGRALNRRVEVVIQAVSSPAR
jgi:outer membrane protein OmpA-like peptidoglycan-associated protein